MQRRLRFTFRLFVESGPRTRTDLRTGTMIRIILSALLLHAAAAADILLSCDLLEDGAVGGGAFVHTVATLVLRDLQVTVEDSEETLSPFVLPRVLDPDLVLIEVKASSVHIPHADVLLHAECNGQEVMCEISRYTTSGVRGDLDVDVDPDPAYFIVTLSVGGAKVSSSLILQTLTVEKSDQTVVQKNLGLPLSPGGSLLTNVIFLVFSQRKDVSSSLGDDVLLHCGFRHHHLSGTKEVVVEWRRQHRGKGQRVFGLRKRMDEEEGDTAAVYSERENSSVDAALVVAEGNASLTLKQVKVTDEGMYICTITAGQFHAQQIVQLFVHQPPQVSISEEKLVFRTASPLVLRCHCSRYFPLNAQIEWFSIPPTETEPVVCPDQGSLSSHRQHNDGTFSLSSHLVVPSTVTPGTKIICQVSHPALDTPVSVSAVVEASEPDSYWWFAGFLFITLLFFYQVMR